MAVAPIPDLKLAEWFVIVSQASVAVAKKHFFEGLAPHRADAKVKDARKVLGSPSSKQADCLRALLACGLDANAPSENHHSSGMTAMMAMLDGCLDTPALVKTLWPFTDLSVVSDSGETALSLSIYGDRVDYAQLFLPSSDAAWRNPLGTTLLMRAAACGANKCLAMLLPLSDARAVNSDGDTALMAAARAFHADTIKALLPHSDPHAKNHQGEDALSLCSRDPDPLDLAFGVDLAQTRACADLLAPLMKTERLREVVSRARANALPLAQALLDQTDLAAVAAEASAPSSFATAGSGEKMPPRRPPLSL